MAIFKNKVLSLRPLQLKIVASLRENLPQPSPCQGGGDSTLRRREKKFYTKLLDSRFRGNDISDIQVQPVLRLEPEKGHRKDLDLLEEPNLFRIYSPNSDENTSCLFLPALT